MLELGFRIDLKERDLIIHHSLQFNFFIQIVLQLNFSKSIKNKFKL